MDEFLTDESPDPSDDDDPVLPRETWYEILGDLFSRLSESDPEKYKLSAIREETPELYERIVEKAGALENLGDALESEVESAYRQLLGLFDQAYWLGKGYAADEMILDEYGGVRAVRIHGRDFAGRPHLRRLSGWATADEEFEPPDGRPVYQLDEIEKLVEMSDAEQEQLIEEKFQ